MDFRGSLFKLALAGLLVISLSAGYELSKRRNFQETKGVVDKIILQMLPKQVTASSSVSPSLAEATIRYSVDGSIYKLNFRRTVPSYTYLYGENVTLYYNPSEPANAVLAPADRDIGNRSLLLTLAVASVGSILISRNRI